VVFGWVVTLGAVYVGFGVVWTTGFGAGFGFAGAGLLPPGAGSGDGVEIASALAGAIAIAATAAPSASFKDLGPAAELDGRRSRLLGEGGGVCN
jgi:hypothetical protein